MASTSGSIESSQRFLVRDLEQEVSSSSGLGDLQSKRLLGKGLNSIGYETEVNGKRFARQDFVGVPSDIFKREASVLVGLEPHENVVETIGWTVDNRSCSLVSEYMEDTVLVFLLKRKQHDKDLPPSQAQPFDMAMKLDIMWQIARGMEYLHDQGVSHGDLKTRNILVNPSYYGRKTTVKVADYGRVGSKRKSMAFASRHARKRDMVRWKAPELLGRMSRRDRDDMVRWESPEHVEGLSTWDGDETSSESDLETSEGANSSSSILWRGNRGEFLSEIYWREGVSAASSSNIYYRECSADVYSFAVTCSQILSNGEDPYPDVGKWKDLKELRDRIVAHDIRPEVPGTCRPELVTLLRSCWGTVPSLRPQFWYIRRALEGLLPHRQGPILAAPYIDHLKQYTPAARVFIVAHLIYNLTCSEKLLAVRGAGKHIHRALSEKPEVIRPYVVEIKVKLSVLWRKMFLLEQKGWMELNALVEVAVVMKVLLGLISKNLRTSPSWLQELSNEIDGIFHMRLPSAERKKWYHLLQNMPSRRPRNWESLVRIQEEFLEMFNLVTQLGEVLFESASNSSKEFLELLEERGRNTAIVKLSVPNLDGDGLRRITDILREKWLNATFDESMKVLRVAGFYFNCDDFKRYVLRLVSRETSSASILSPGEPIEGPQTGTVSDQEEHESEGPRERHRNNLIPLSLQLILSDVDKEEHETEVPGEIHKIKSYVTKRPEVKEAASRKESGITKASGNKKAAGEKKGSGIKNSRPSYLRRRHDAALLRAAEGPRIQAPGIVKKPSARNRQELSREEPSVTSGNSWLNFKNRGKTSN